MPERNGVMAEISIELQEQLNTLILPVLILAGLAFVVCVDSYVKRSFRYEMLAITAIILTLIIDNVIANKMMEAWDPVYTMAKTALSVYSYVMRPVCILLFIYILWDDPKRRLFWILIGLNTCVYLTAFFGPWVFMIHREDGLFFRGPLGYTAHFVSSVLLIVQMVIVFSHFRNSRRVERLIPAVNSTLAIIAMLMDKSTETSGTITFSEIVAVFCSVSYYFWLHLQFVREHENALKAEQQIKIMFSQIQPHFLYNTLTTIQALCLENPRKAAVITEKFALYMRQNIDSLNWSSLIPFRKELDHVLVYAEIEMARFPNIHLDYEIEDEDFLIPMLTIQPLVENAIRHGVRGMPRGQIDIIVNLLPDGHEIVIRDNGKGFSMKEQPDPDSPHIGIQNVRERLEKMCGGTMTIDSKLGGGTRVIMRLPRRKESL